MGREARGPPVVAGVRAGVGGSAAGDGADDGGHRADLGRAGVSVQPVGVGRSGGSGWRRSPGLGRSAALLEPDALLYYWPYGRHGINFHPPLAGQLDLLTYAVFGHWVKDIPARRMASVFEYRADDRAGVRLPGAAVWGVGRRGHGRARCC